MKKSKKDQKKIVARYIAKYEEFSKLPSEDLVILQDKKMSSTDALALRDVVNQKMKEEIMNQRMKNMEEKENIVDIPGQGILVNSEGETNKPIVDLNKILDESGDKE